MIELEGRLIYTPNTGYLILSVPNAIGIGFFQALNLPGLELPKWRTEQRFNCHLTVMRPNELASIGGIEKITERGKMFRYRIAGVDSSPSKTDGFSRFYYLQVTSPQLSQLRRSYGLPGSPAVPFHITFAARRRNVLRENSVRKVASYGPISEIASRSGCMDWPSKGNLH